MYIITDSNGKVLAEKENGTNEEGIEIQKALNAAGVKSMLNFEKPKTGKWKFVDIPLVSCKMFHIEIDNTIIFTVAVSENATKKDIAILKNAKKCMMRAKISLNFPWEVQSQFKKF